MHATGLSYSLSATRYVTKSDQGILHPHVNCKVVSLAELFTIMQTAIFSSSHILLASVECARKLFLLPY